MGHHTNAVMIACLAVLLILIVAVWQLAGAPRGCGPDRFFTLHGQEEPTRSYTPYTGTIPFGSWGTLPWAEAHPAGAPTCHEPASTFCDTLQPRCTTCRAPSGGGGAELGGGAPGVY
jgi:hypothetical protein